MDSKKLADAAKPAKLGAYVAELSSRPEIGHSHGHSGHAESIRETVYAGHKIVVRTMYEVSVDGKAVPVPLGVDDQGQLHCHALPNYQFTSALDAIKTLIDRFPDDFKKRAARRQKTARKKSHRKKSSSSRGAAGHKHPRRAKKGTR